MALATISQFASVMSITPTTAQKTSIGTALDQATGLIEGFTDRIFGQATYSKWYSTENYPAEPTIIWVDQYPITKISMVGVPSPVAQITNNNAAATISSVGYDANVVSLAWFATDGTENEVNIPVSTNKTLTTLKSAIEANVGWQLNIDTQYVNYPSVLIQPFQASQTTGASVQINLPVNNGLTGKIYDESGIQLNGTSSEIYAKYVSGYQLSVDNADNTALLVVGNVPKELVFVCIQLANDIMAFAKASLNSSGVSPNQIQSETLGDYSYSKFDTAKLEQLVQKYQTILDKFTKKFF